VNSALRTIQCDLDATRIATRIYQGSAPPPGSDVRRCEFDVLVLSAKEYQPPAEMFPGVSVVHVPLDDAELGHAEWIRAVAAADKVARQIRDRDARALITCAMGRNRSGLVTAITLHLLTGEAGYKIVRHIQRRRQNALTNPSFVKTLMRLGAPR